MLLGAQPYARIKHFCLAEMDYVPNMISSRHSADIDATYKWTRTQKMALNVDRTQILPPPPPFSPHSIANLQVWTDASDPATNGTSNRVSSIYTTTTTATLKPNELNGKPVLNFNPSQFWRIDGTPNINPYTLYFVSRYLPGANERIFQSSTNQLYGYWKGGGSPREIVLYIDDNPKLLPFGGWSGTAADNIWDIGGHSRTAGSAWDLRWNGNVTAGGGGSTGNPMTGLFVNGVNSEWSDCQVAEILLFNRVLSSTEKEIIEGYLAWKWGLQGNLPLDHPYKNAKP